jgi:hypothetical protein
MAFLLTYCFIAVIVSSYILWFILPMGTGMHGENLEHCVLDGLGPKGNALFVFGLPRFSWVDIHSWISIGIMVIIIIHLILHWKWISESLKRTGNYAVKKLWYILERYSTVLILFIFFIFETISGLVLWLILPRGVLDYYNMKSGLGFTFWGLQRNEWVDLHAWVAVAALSVVIIHVIIHRRWVVNMFSGKVFKRDNSDSLRKSYNDPAIKESGGLVEGTANVSFKSTKNDWNESKDLDNIQNQGYRKRLGLHFGLFGVVSFTVLITMLTVAAGKPDILWIGFPGALISLIIAWKKPFAGGLSMLVLAIVAIFINTGTADIMGYARYIPGLELIYTIFFVSIPLIISAACLLLSLKNKEQQKLPAD